MSHVTPSSPNTLSTTLPSPVPDPMGGGGSGGVELRRRAPAPHPPVYVSLTTVRRSAHLLRLTLSSLLDQTVQPEQVFVALTRSLTLSAADLHDWRASSRVQARGGARLARLPPPAPSPSLALRALFKRSACSLRRSGVPTAVLWYDEDLGPAMKYLPAAAALANDTSALLVVVDDDKAYPPTLLADLLAGHDAHPAAAVACRGWAASASCEYDDELARSVYGHRLARGPRGDAAAAAAAAAPVDVVTGSDGYLFRPAAFAEDGGLWTFPSQQLREAAKMDDVWISGQLATRGVPRLVVPCTHEARNVAPSLIPHGRIDTGWTSRGELNTVLLKHFCPHWLHASESRARGGGERRRWQHQQPAQAAPAEEAGAQTQQQGGGDPLGCPGCIF
eukprot:scaffold12.g8006.t1